jgi:hypothetical protein
MIAQEKTGPSSHGTLKAPILVPSIADQIQNGTFIGIDDFSAPAEAPPKRRAGNFVVPGKGLPQAGRDAAMQEEPPFNRVAPPTLVFDADTTPQAGVTDPTGAAGPSHYIAAWNFGFRIFDKNGNPLTPEASLATIFPGNAIGDPIVLYDPHVDRYIITEFDSSPNGFNFAISQGPDPVNSGWYVYDTGFTTGQFPDYTKFSIWSDGYYVTANINQGNPAAANSVFVIERDEIIQGNPAGFQGFPLPGCATSGFYSPQAFNVGTGSLPPVGTGAPIVYLQDDAWGGVSNDHLKIWTVDVDWNTPGNSTISAPVEINTTSFISVFDGGSFSNLSQPSGPDQDALQATIMNQAQYRRFGSHNSAVFNFVVDTDAGSGELAGIRWYELRQTSDGQPWTIFQEGTYTSPFGGKHAFSGSMAINADGDIGMGYTTVSNTESIAIYYTGRFDGDAPGQMTVVEELIAQSTANNPGNRLADYVHLTIDPADDLTFWHIAEYFNTNRRDVVGVFSLTPPQANDIGMISIDEPVNGVLTATEDIVVTIRNFGSNDIMDPEVQYSIDGGTPVVENYSGTIAAGTTEQYTFTQTADLSAPGSYVIEAKTNLSGDSNTGNDTATKTVTNGLIYCQPSADCSFGDGFQLISIEQINNPSGCEGYGDFTNQVANLDPDTTYDLTVTTGYGDQFVSAWIDFNDDGTFTSNELVVDNFEIADGQGAGSYTETFDLVVPAGAALGDHRMRFKSNWDAPVPANACDATQFGETEDYTAQIGELGIQDRDLADANLIVVTKPNNQFEITLVTSFDEVASIAIYNALGQIVAFNNITKEGDRYVYNLDMSHASSGIYMVKFGDEASSSYKSAKFIVN